VLSSANGHDGIVRFAAERVDVVVLDVNSDAAETAVIAGELKRTRANVPVIMLVTEEQTLAEGVLEIADAVVLRSDQSKLLKTLDSLQRAGRS
jgi:DNA-binding response OmpR family regulator